MDFSGFHRLETNNRKTYVLDELEVSYGLEPSPLS